MQLGCGRLDLDEEDIIRDSFIDFHFRQKL